MTDTLQICENGILRDATPDEIAEIEARAADYAANESVRATESFKTERAAKLAATDWWAIRASEVGGAPMTEEQLAYRQALRAMDDAVDFDPLNVVWPAMPA
jgi:hypothetical protein